MSNFRVALGLSFFTFLITLGWTADIQVAVAWSGFVGFIAFLALTVVEFIPYEEDEQREKKDDRQDYQLFLRIKDTETNNDDRLFFTNFDRQALRVLLSNLKSGRGAFYEVKKPRGMRQYDKGMDLDRVLKQLTDRGYIARTNSHASNAPYIITRKGERLLRNLDSTTPPPNKDMLEVRI